MVPRATAIVDLVNPQIQRAADRLKRAAETGQPCAPVRDLIGEHDIDAAYAVQELLTAQRAATTRVVGRKIGLTSDSVRSQFGVYQPDFGTLFADMGYATGEAVPLGRLLQPRVEAEIAFVLGRDIDLSDASVTDVIRATDFVVAAIEIVDSRVDGWDIRITDTVADNASSGLYTLGCTPFSLNGLDLAQVGMVVEHDGEPVSVGSGAACMANPIVAVAWLAREVARRGAPLRAGEVVLSGALGPMVKVTAPGVFTARLDGLGKVQAVFTDDGGA
ncbi:2-keto-4-pentenoate hydratase [Kutzneria sp. CA-103260]|uniref:2-keto-4-pentenoate hydratase n=1 Tax=Kutzneria sp. CA-103260 TaxID=2802641 RepID=UPI001BA53B63|nr:fumarylacetoacetate hydrolase family protein [Kutzneria sp. CA-103260]QUQ63487.1 2-keto-4-pentenoate hydratase [Kutzneria sp. CA-103260]